MAFEKGKPKTGGKKKGTANKVTTEVREVFKGMMERQLLKVEDAFDELRAESAEKYLTCLSKILPYFMPKQIDLKSDGEQLKPPVIQILPYTEEK